MKQVVYTPACSCPRMVKMGVVDLSQGFLPEEQFQIVVTLPLAPRCATCDKPWTAKTVEIDG